MASQGSTNKLDREKSLVEAAYELFTDKGVVDTTINNIVERAGVAKGTFYLYFENKYDLLERIILEKSKIVLDEAILKTRVKDDYKTFEEEVLTFIDYIIEYLKENRLLLKLIYKNLSWGIFKKAYKDYDEVHEIYSLFERGYSENNLSKEDITSRLFMIIELTGSVCYSCIILNEPTNIDSMKPHLFEAIGKII